MTLSEKIAYCRRRNGLSQEELAEKISVSRQAVSKWETGEAQPEIGKLRQLSDAFGVSTDWLLSEEEPVEPKQAPVQNTASEAEKLPGILGKLFRRFGWLAGVYTIVAGTLISIVGLAAILISNAMLNGFHESASQMYGMYDGFGSMASVMESATPINPVAIIGTIVLVFGVLVLIFGIVLTVLLLRLRKKAQAEG
ncbi:MAG: helix-turn-helix domain-containing protein [Clostridia bacterium]|nr:helix-turn-helix domain-containing protein [Clostridia bacterium]